MKRSLLVLVLAGSFGLAQQQPAHSPEAHPAGGQQAEHGGGHAAPSQAWKWFNFGLLAAGIGWMAVKKGGPFFRERGRGIRYEIEKAGKSRREAEARAAEVEKRLAGLSAELAAMREASELEMEAESARIEGETERILAKIRHTAEQEISAGRRQAISELRSHAAGRAVELAETRIRARMSPEIAGQLIEAFSQTLPRAERTKN